LLKFWKNLKKVEKIDVFWTPIEAKTTKRKNVGRFTIYLRKPQKRPFLGPFLGFLGVGRKRLFFGQKWGFLLIPPLVETCCFYEKTAIFLRSSKLSFLSFFDFLVVYVVNSCHRRDKHNQKVKELLGFFNFLCLSLLPRTLRSPTHSGGGDQDWETGRKEFGLCFLATSCGWEYIITLW
jgi:hypothetical protein